MNSIAANNFGTAGKDLLKIQADTAQMNCHVSPLLYKIRDHGPAILDGEFYKDVTAALPGKAQAPTVAPAIEQPAGAPVVSQLQSRGVNRVMLFSILLLAIALVSMGFYAYQQKMYVNDLQAAIKIYDDLDKEFK